MRKWAVPLLIVLLVGVADASAQETDFRVLAGASPAGSNDGSDEVTGGDARFNVPTGIAVDSSGTLYVTDTHNYVIRRITGAGAVTTFAGEAGEFGSADGVGGTASFGGPQAAAVDIAGNVYIADTFNHTIRKITPAGVVSTFAGLAGNSGSTDNTGSAARFNSPRGVAVDSAGNRVCRRYQQSHDQEDHGRRCRHHVGGLPEFVGDYRCDWQQRAIQSTSGDCRRRRGHPVCSG